MSSERFLYLPAELAELLHATLGPLAETLERDGHEWAAMVRRVLHEYTARRNQFLSQMHGDSVLPEIGHLTYLAAERVCGLADMAVREEEDFFRWTLEVNGESESA